MLAEEQQKFRKIQISYLENQVNQQGYNKCSIKTLITHGAKSARERSTIIESILYRFGPKLSPIITLPSNLVLPTKRR